MRLAAFACALAAGFAAAPPGPETVYNDAGYIQVGQVSNSTTERSLFYWFFESRGNPDTDPFILWMSGGPGCSGQLAMFGENGPYKVNEDLSLRLNNNSWNTNANVLWIDQPAGAGFSKGPPVLSEKTMAEDMWEFLEKFFAKYPKYAKQEFQIIGESYAGHYVPALSSYILDQNDARQLALKTGTVNEDTPKNVINFAGAAIGNGLTSPAVQFKYYVPYAKEAAARGYEVVSKKAITAMRIALPACEGLTKLCETMKGQGSMNASLKIVACQNAYETCAASQLMPAQFAGANLYDVRGKCDPNLPLCYNFTLIENYLNQPAVKQALGVTKKWSECNRLVDMGFVEAGDWMLNFENDVVKMLERGHRVMIYAGEFDFICNWLGNHAWTDALQWSGSAAYSQATNSSWEVGGTAAGSFKSAKGLTFVKVFGAGHMVPRDQPVNALDMVNRHIQNRPLGV